MTGPESRLPSFADKLASICLSCAVLLAMAIGVEISGRAATPEEGELPVTVPEGFKIERVATAPLLERPMFATFDHDGRLYVMDSGGVNGDDRMQKPPDVIRRLEDTDGDGVFDESVVVAEDIVFGTGLVWHEGDLFVTSPPSVWRFEDTTNDGKFDKRTELVTGFAFNQSCSDDVHGACLGPDGRIYFLPGRFKHRVQIPGGEVLKEGFGPWLMRCKPDGTEIEFVSGAVGNPVEVAFLPNGDAFVQGTFWAKPSVGGGLRDAAIHIVEGAEYSVRDRDYPDRVRTGDFLPALVPMTATAPSGIGSYRSDVFGPQYQNNLFAALFNTGTVMRVIPREAGSTYLADIEDFVVGSHGDIHFTDALEDADGSLLVIDTGGWFRACCPASGIAKPDVYGAIYRVTRTDVDPVDDPRGLKLNWNDMSPTDLTNLLGDPRPAVSDRAITEAARRGEAAVAPLQTLLENNDASVLAKMNALWTLCRIDDESARDASRVALEDSAADVRQVAASVAALHRDAEARAALENLLLNDPDPSVRREAANGLGRIGDAESVESLLNALGDAEQPAVEDPSAIAMTAEATVTDPFLEHSLVLALIRINDPAATREGLSSPNPLARRASLIALDQMPNGDLTAEEVTELLSSDDMELRRTAVGILLRHVDWSEQVAALMREWLEAEELSDWQSATLEESVRAFRDDNDVRELLTEQFSQPGELSSPAAISLLKAVAGSGLRRIPDEWASGIGKMLSSGSPEVQQAALQAAARFRLASLNDQLRALARDNSAVTSVRLAAIRGLSANGQSIADEEFEFLMSRLQPQVPVQERLTGLEVLASLNSGDERLMELIPYVQAAGPIELPHFLQAFRQGDSEELGSALVAALERSPAELSAVAVSEALEGYPESVKAGAAGLMAKLRESASQQAQKLAAMERIQQDHPGDPQRGRQLFLGKANCHLCHRIQGEGGQVGPDLTGIGAIRTHRDLLEAILYPSATFARGYEPVMLALADGRVMSGLMGRETPEEVVLIEVRENKPVEVPIRRDDIDIMQLGRVSVMPQGLDTQLTEQEFSDLLAYLKSLREKS